MRHLKSIPNQPGVLLSFVSIFLLNFFVVGCKTALPLVNDSGTTETASSSSKSQNVTSDDKNVSAAERSASLSAKSASDAHAVLEKIEKNLKEARELSENLRQGEEKCRAMTKSIPRKVKCPECTCETSTTSASSSTTANGAPATHTETSVHSAVNTSTTTQAETHTTKQPDFSKNDAP